MLTTFRTCLVTALLLSCATGVFSQTQDTAATVVAEAKAKQIAAFLATGNRAEYQKFVESNYNDELLKTPMERHLGFFSSIYDSSRGFEVIGRHDAKAAEVILLVKNKLTGVHDGLLVRVEPNPPHKIAGLGMRRVPQPESRRPIGSREIAAQMDGYIKRVSEANVFSGSVLLAKDGKVVYQTAVGLANKDFGVANKIDTKFNLGSMNKMFTGVAVAQLVEQGKLSYDDPLSKFIPDFPNAEAAQKIKIKHLLTHTAGLGGYFSGRYDSMSRARLRTVDDMLNLAREDEKGIAFEPGSRWQYSNTGMMVLGKVIEIASGKSYFDYVRENIHVPAGMVNTDCYELDKVNTNLAVGYDKVFTDNGIAWRNNIFDHVMRGGPQGGGYSTAEDLLKFDRALRSGKLVSSDTFKLLTSPKPELNSPNYGYGFSANPAMKTTGHSGGFTGINSDLRMDLSGGWTIIVMSNYSRAAGPVSSKLASLVGLPN